MVGGTQYLLGDFGGGSAGLNGNPIGSPLTLTESVAPGDLSAVFAGLQSSGFAFSVKIHRTNGDFDVIDAADASAGMEAPEPATVGLFGIGLAALVALRRRIRGV